MKNLRQLIKESLLLEKRIAQIATKIEVNFAFDVDRTHHAYIRRKREGIEGYDEREISNGELKFIIEQVRKEIAEKITVGEINMVKRLLLNHLKNQLPCPLFLNINRVLIGYYILPPCLENLTTIHLEQVKTN